jgi:hypothetical protein
LAAASLCACPQLATTLLLLPTTDAAPIMCLFRSHSRIFQHGPKRVFGALYVAKPASTSSFDLRGGQRDLSWIGCHRVCTQLRVRRKLADGKRSVRELSPVKRPGSAPIISSRPPVVLLESSTSSPEKASSRTSATANMHRPRASLGKLLLHAVAAAALVAVALGDGLPLDGDPLQLRYTGPNPCSVDGQLLDTVQVSL